MIFIVYFIGTIGLIYCRLIFKLANRKRGHTICTQIMCASKYPSALIHPQTIHARKYTNRHIVFCITHTRIAPHSPPSALKIQIVLLHTVRPIADADIHMCLRCLHVVMPENMFFFFANKQILLK